jgi:cytochrome c nitrite reductase small subunit
MKEQYDSWRKGSHQAEATCNDCHLPHDSVLAKYGTKAEDGLLHVTKFTLGTYPQNITIRDKSQAIVNAACLDCHGDLTTEMRYTMSAADEQIRCTRCHSTVGHD